MSDPDDFSEDEMREQGPLAIEDYFLGLTVRELATLFSMSYQRVLQRIRYIKSCGLRKGQYVIYDLPSVAPFLVEPKIDMEHYLKSLPPSELPPKLQKAFWDGQKARQTFEEEAGNLWHTHRVQAAIGKFVAMVRQRLVLATDQLDRMTPLNDEQRVTLQGMHDSLVSDLQQEVIDQFKDYDAKGDRQAIFEKGPEDVRSRRLLLQVDEEDSKSDDGLDL